MPEITKNQIKQIRLLQQKKYRQEFCQFVVEGEKNVQELLNSDFEVENLYAVSDWEPENYTQEITRVTNKQLSQISNLSSPNKVLAVAKISNKKFHNNLLGNGLTLVLEDINDPGNLGTIIRTADWFGVKNIICSPNSVDCFNPKVVQSTKGSLFRTNVFYMDLKEILSHTKTPIYGAILGGKEITKETVFEKNAILLMGSESHGISEELLPLISREISIKQFGNAESLNVGIATGILLNSFSL